MRGKSFDEISDRSAALATLALGLEDLDARLRKPAEVRERVLDLVALGLHVAQLVERTRVERADESAGRVSRWMRSGDHLLVRTWQRPG